MCCCNHSHIHLFLLSPGGNICHIGVVEQHGKIKKAGRLKAILKFTLFQPPHKGQDQNIKKVVCSLWWVSLPSDYTITFPSIPNLVKIHCPKLGKDL